MQKHEIISSDSVRIPCIHSIGFSDDRAITHFGPSVRNQYIIHYVLSGRGIFNGNYVEKGQGFLITPGLYEEYHSDESAPWSFLWIISEDDSMTYFFNAHRADKETGIFKFHNLYEIESVASELNKVYNGFSFGSRLSEIFLNIFHRCVISEEDTKYAVTKSYFDFSEKYIRSNLHLGIRVDELCKALGITQPYLYKIFKENSGLSPKRYITEKRIAEAKRLLKMTELSITHIANSLAFFSVIDFSKFFQKEVRTTPSEYRIKNR